MKEFKLFILSCFAIICVALFGSVFTSCSNDDDLVPSNCPQDKQITSYSNNTLINFEGEINSSTLDYDIELNQFPMDKLFDLTFLSSPKCTIGKSKEFAVVSLLFDENNKLYTPNRYNKEAKSGDFHPNIYLTDLKTFYEVTKFPYAKPEYVKDPLCELYLFDAYQSSYKIYNVNLEDTKNKTPIRTAYNLTTLTRGDIVYTSDSRTYYVIQHGHVAGITNNTNSTPPGAFSNVYDIEAISTGVVSATLGTGSWWSSRSNIYSLVYNGSDQNSSKRNEVAVYLNSKIGEPYYTNSEFLTEWASTSPYYQVDNGKWYCSKLLWHAFYHTYSIDIDYDQGSIVWPIDIYNSSYFTKTSLAY